LGLYAFSGSNHILGTMEWLLLRIHSCFTSPGSWFYQGLAGIKADVTAPAFKRIIIKPAIIGDLKMGKGRNTTHVTVVLKVPGTKG